MNIVLVYNPRSGSALSRKQLSKLCEKHGITITAYVKINDSFPASLKPYAKKDQIIAVVGGDGSISSTASFLTGSKAILAPIPGGTLNHFTKDLGIPQDADEAFGNLARSRKSKKIDIATINDVAFINNSSIGMYAASLKTRETMERMLLGKRSAMILGSFHAFLHYRPLSVTIKGETFRTPLLFVGNNDYHIDTPLAMGRKRLDAGILSAYAIVASSRLGILRVIWHALSGGLKQDADFRIWKTDHITITTGRTQVRVSRDGELTTVTSPLEYRVAPGALRVIGSS